MRAMRCLDARFAATAQSRAPVKACIKTRDHIIHGARTQTRLGRLTMLNRSRQRTVIAVWETMINTARCAVNVAAVRFFVNAL